MKQLGRYLIRYANNRVYDLEFKYFQIIMRQCTVKPA